MRPTPRPNGTALAVSLLVVALAACGGDDDDTATTSTAPTDATTVPAEPTPDDAATTDEGGNDAPVTVAVGETAFGPTLVDADGRTLYVFDQDGALTSTCDGGCATLWPPLTFEGEPLLGDDLDGDRFEAFTRDDGTTQLAVDGMPLYRFDGDTGPGDVNGHGVGGVWWAVGPDGEQLT